MIEALTNRFAVFGRRLEAADSEDEKIRMIFEAMLTREPTVREMEIARAEISANRETAYDGLVWALLNTRQFLFIQWNSGKSFPLDSRKNDLIDGLF